MSGRSRSYKDGLYRRLRDNAEAVNYLQAALEDSQSAFLVALRNVLEARNLAAIARESHLDRVHIYRMLSEGGNPTLNSLERLLHALGLKLAIDLEAGAAPTQSEIFRSSWKTHSACRSRHFVVKSTKVVYHTSSAHPANKGLRAESVHQPPAIRVPHPAFIPENEEICELAY